MNRRDMLGAIMAAMATGGPAAGRSFEQPSDDGSSQDGAGRFVMPAEEAPHARTWMCWASTLAIYHNDVAYFEAVQETIGRLAAAIAEHEPVMMLAEAAQHERARALCGPKVTLVDIPTDDMWSRDTGPLFVRGPSGEKALVDLNFNGWGGKQEHGLDGRVAGAIAAHLGAPRRSSKLVGEGGGLEVDGDGTLFLTDSCWENDNRNPGMTRDEIAAELRALLGVEKVIWLPGVRGLEITDGHIDGSIRFVRPGLLMTSAIPGDTSIWGETHEEALAILRRSTDARGRAFEIVDAPWAETWRSTDPEFFAGYANFYVGNGAVYTPEFGDPRADAHAQRVLGALFPDRRVVALNVDRIYENGGGVHCVTQQEPA